MRVQELVDGGLLAFGGFAASTTQANSERHTWRLAPGDDRWRRCADLVHPHAFFGSAVLDGTVYAIGEAVERYDANADRWQVVVPPGTLPRSHSAACAHDGALWVIGGVPARGTGFFRIDVATGAVEALPAPPGYGAGDHLHFLVSLRGELHLFGGMRNAPWGATDEHFVRRDGRWFLATPSPAPLWSKFGGTATHGERQYFWCENGGFAFRPADDTWERRADAPALLAMPATIALGDSIWWLGGMPVERGSSTTWRYDIAADRWIDEGAAANGAPPR